jgi:hypothetical protein
MDTPEPSPTDVPKGYDAGFLRDIADMVKNKTLFFIPFFGAYLAFIFRRLDSRRRVFGRSGSRSALTE